MSFFQPKKAIASRSPPRPTPTSAERNEATAFFEEASRSFDETAGSTPRSSGHRYMIIVAENAATSPRNQRKYSPIDDCANECTLAIAPDRVRNVPKIVMKNVRQIRKMFQTLSIPRRSWVITEC